MMNLLQTCELCYNVSGAHYLIDTVVSERSVDDLRCLTEERAHVEVFSVVRFYAMIGHICVVIVTRPGVDALRTVCSVDHVSHTQIQQQRFVFCYSPEKIHFPTVCV